MNAERRLVFRVEYDGTAYRGWQRQPGLPTVQQSLTDAINDVVGETILDGASRTDSGVHARDQLASAVFHHPIRPNGFVKAVNRRLPIDISIRDAHEVDVGFEVRGVRPAKTYAYRIYFGPCRRAMTDRTAWHVRWTLDAEAVARASAHLVGVHDFNSFAAANHGRATTVREVYDARLTVKEDHWVWQITGGGFLKQMVRNIVGTLADVGRGHRDAEEFPGIIEASARSAAGPTAPARGLTLERVWWSLADGHTPKAEIGLEF